MVDLRRFFFQIHQDYSKDTVVASADVLTVLCVRRVLQMPSDMLIHVRWGHVFFSLDIFQQKILQQPPNWTVWLTLGQLRGKSQHFMQT